MTLKPDNTTGIPFENLEQIDKVCLRFESAWRAGSSPRIDDYVDGLANQLRPMLISELLLLDIDYRRKNGEHPLATDYYSRLTNDSSTIDSVFTQLDALGKAGETPVPYPIDTASEPTTLQEPPQQLGRYRIVRKLGAGGFGTVYLARDEELQREVAVKIPHWSPQAEFMDNRQFLEEARILATLSHPAIVPVYDFGRLKEDHRICFVVSQLMDGGDLGEYLAATRPSTDETVRIIIRLAEALNYAHEKGLVHRDVKSSNILRDANGDVFVSDFGLAIRHSCTENGIGFAGTPAYMSPEQARGGRGLVDGRTDIYALGVIFYEMLAGFRPFRAPNVTRLLESIQHDEPKPLRQINDSIPLELEGICLKTLAKRPDDRYSTAIELADDLRAWQNASNPATRTVRRDFVMGLIAVSLLAVVSWFVLGFVTGSSPTPIESLAILPFTTPDLAEEDKYLGLAIADGLITKLGIVRQLKVRPTGAIRHYAESASDPLLSGKELLVDAVLEGSIQRVDQSILATVRLIKVSDGKTLWTGKFTEPSHELFAIQDYIAENVSRILELEMSIEERTRFDRRSTESRAAQEAYLKGRYYWNQRVSQDGINKAIRYYKAAIDEDPLFALAYAGLGEAYVLKNMYSYYQTEDVSLMGKAAAEQALKLDEGLTEAVATLAYVKFYYEYDWDGAEQEFLRAIKLNPNYATARQWYAEYLYYMGRFDEALFQLDRASELDPLSPIIRSLRGSPWVYRGDFDRARQEYQKALDLHPDSLVAMYGLATCYEQQFKFDEALQTYTKMSSPPAKASLIGQAGEAYVHAMSGNEDQARTILRRLNLSVDHGPISPYALATIHAGLGEVDEAMDLLTKAVEVHDDRITWLKVDPKFDDLRSEPRFIEFLGKIGLGD